MTTNIVSIINSKDNTLLIGRDIKITLRVYTLIK